MKKQAIAAAVAAAFAVPAMAQVTVSGMIEAGYVSRDSEALKTNTIGAGFFGTPHVKFTGAEDLGGGLKAGFHLQMDLNGGPSASNNTLNPFANNGATSTNEHFSVASANISGGFGRIEIGKFSVAPRDGGGVYRFMGDIGRLASTSAGASMNSAAYMNAVQYSTPTISGISANFYSSQAGKVDTAADPGDATGYNLTGSVAGVRFSLGTEQAQTATTAADSKARKRLDTLAVSYDFGIARVGIVSATDKSEATSQVKTDAQGLHLATTQGATTFGASVTRYKRGASKNDVVALGAKYDLSKRTNVTATYQTVKASTTIVDFATRGLLVSGRDNATTNGYGLQVQHNF